MKRRINRREFAAGSLGGALLPTAVSAQTAPAAAAPARQPVGPPKLPARAVQVFPGVWKLTLGTPEAFTPVKLRRRKPAEAGLKKLAPASQCPLPVSAVRGRSMKRGFVVTLPLEAGEVVYGLGLQLMSLIQRGTKKTLRVNADPRNDAGDSHAPAPFYVSTRGYGCADRHRALCDVLPRRQDAPRRIGRSSRRGLDHRAEPPAGLLPAALRR